LFLCFRAWKFLLGPNFVSEFAAYCFVSRDIQLYGSIRFEIHVCCSNCLLFPLFFLLVVPSVRILYRKYVGLGCRHRWGRNPLGLGRRNPSRRLLPPPSRRPNPNGLPQPIRVRVRGGAAPSAAASPGRRSPWPPALGGSSPPIYYTPVEQYNHPILPQLSSTLKMYI
jgi:hypothetical protein